MKTKIIATVGPACDTPEMLRKLAESGASIFRLNFSHGSPDSFVEIIRNIRALEEDLGRPITILQDLAGPKIRIGDLPGPVEFMHGDTALLGPAKPEQCGDMPFIPFDKMEILNTLEPGDHLVLADGSLQLEVLEAWPNNVFVLEAQNSGIVTSRKGLALPGKAVALPALTDKDKSDLKAGLKMGVDIVALSYVQTPEDIIEAKTIIRDCGKDIPVLAKLERHNAVERLDEILQVVDAVMVARGDLGIECPLPVLPTMQKRIIRACNKAAKPVIVATQMLLSMVNSPAPTRAETTDVANAVLDGADGVMLSEETAMGNFPMETVKFMSRIAEEAESLLKEKKSEAPGADNPSEFLSYSACLLADATKSVALVAHSMSGAAGRAISARRPAQPVYVLTPDPVVLHYLNLSWGVKPVLITTDIPGHLERAETFAEENPEFKNGDHIVITAGQPRPGETKQGTNLVKIFRK